MMNSIDGFIARLEERNLNPRVNSERPLFVQPEDRILFRATRIVLILGMLNAKTGLSKEVVSCVDFLLRNPGYQKKFIIEYFKNKSYFLKKLHAYSPSKTIEIDFNIVQYKSVPWDLRFNDMFLYLHVRDFVKFIGERPALRVILTASGTDLYNSVKEIFTDEVNFLELFGSRLSEDKAKEIITGVIPNSYWKEKENENFDY